HTVSAVFQSETIEIAFELKKSVPQREAARPEPAPALSPVQGEDGGFPMPIAMAVIVLILAFGAATAVIKTRRGKVVK
ncbi:MAG: hypothetical protein LBB57_01520, partial [Clostridiales Family XIII bacterium]|nr:hypothetical protein [Clostridiales Family XIII bacterium]